LDAAGRFAVAGFGNPAAKPLDLAIQREQSRIGRFLEG
jgi:hypothetical protein